jgi:hypothetical protein
VGETDSEAGSEEVVEEGFGSDDWRARVAASLPEGAADDLNTQQLAVLEDEVSLGEDDQTKTANAALRALARASRAYLIYDARNEIIKTFLGNLKDAFERYAVTYGDLPLEVRPFELALHHKVVYLERDRERSLAFKLFRDGVRNLTIRSGVTWEELTALLQILSIRYIGVRLNEDDILTLLWKAGFTHIEVEAVEGFIEDDEEETQDGAATGAALAELQASLGAGANPDASADVTFDDEQMGDAVGGGGASLKAPPGFDLPAPELPPPIEPRRQFLPDGWLEELRNEAGSSGLAEEVLRLIDYLLRGIQDPVEYLVWDDARHFLREARDFLMSEGEIDYLLRYQDLLSWFAGAPELDDDTGDAARALLQGFADEAALRRILRSIPMSVVEPPEEYRRLLTAAAGDTLAILFDLLDNERSHHLRRIVRQLIEGFLPDRGADVIEKFRSSEGEVAADLLRVMVGKDPELARQSFRGIVQGDDNELKVEFLRQAQAGTLQADLRGHLMQLLTAPEPRIRVRALKVIAMAGERGAFQPLLRRCEDVVKRSNEDLELDAYGRAMAHIDPIQALEVFREWGKPLGRFQVLITGTVRAQRKVALSGLSAIDAEEATNIIRTYATGARDEQLRDEARKELGRRARAKRLAAEGIVDERASAPTDSFDALTGAFPSIDTGRMQALSADDLPSEADADVWSTDADEPDLDPFGGGR